VQPFQAPGEPGSAPPADMAGGDPFAALFGAPEGTAQYPAQGQMAAPYGQEGYGAAPYGQEGYGAPPQGGGYPAYPPPGAEGYGMPPTPQQGGYAPDGYNMGGAFPTPQPQGNDAFGFGGTGGFGMAGYGNPDMSGYNTEHPQGSSPGLIGRPPLTRAQVSATIPCPNCGELVTENALSCPRCDYRFYAPCPNCGEYIDTGDPSATGKDICPRCSQAVDKLALGRAGARSGMALNPREAMLAAGRQHRAQEEAAAVQAAGAAKAAEKKVRRSPAGVLLLFILILVLIVAAAYVFPVPILSDIVHSVLPGPTPTP
jgi:hypothetical protein